MKVDGAIGIAGSGPRGWVGGCLEKSHRVIIAHMFCFVEVGWWRSERVQNMDIIRYRENLMDKLQYFTLYTQYMLIIFFRETLSKLCTLFDSYRMYLGDFEH